MASRSRGYGVKQAAPGETSPQDPVTADLVAPRVAGGRRRHVVPLVARAGWRPAGTDQVKVPDQGTSRAAARQGPDPGVVVAVPGVERARGPHRAVVCARPGPGYPA